MFVQKSNAILKVILILKCPAVKEQGEILRIPLLEIQNNFYNRFAFPNKHQVLSFWRDFLWEFGEQFWLSGI